MRKAQQEVAEFHRLQKLTDELIVLNQKICELRLEQEPGGWTVQEKNGCCTPSRGLAGSQWPG